MDRRAGLKRKTLQNTRKMYSLRNGSFEQHASSFRFKSEFIKKKNIKKVFSDSSQKRIIYSKVQARNVFIIIFILFTYLTKYYYT